MQNKDYVTIYTDGACKGNPGIGGYGAVLLYNQHQKEIFGTALNTTNNRMELYAAIAALKALKRPCNVILYTDSQYLQKGITVWIKAWKHKNWQHVKNKDLWHQLDEICQVHNISWNWVRGHNGNPMNEKADQLANHAISEYLKSSLNS